MENKYFKALKYGLSGAELLSDPAAVQRDCNGIGPEWFPCWMRWAITALCPSLVLAADIHDRRYSIGGDRNARLQADAEFLGNIVVIADRRYRYFPPLRRLVECLGFRMYRILRYTGEKAWKEVNTDDE